ncbi:hypothetical protein KEM48_013491 [Puccinia striiformis f. sp. tritici PST-130]|nr:hypothetical protein KEM48_013491 [Puccinia striiformis f. sp. tritici PST-130]
MLTGSSGYTQQDRRAGTSEGRNVGTGTSPPENLTLKPAYCAHGNCLLSSAHGAGFLDQSIQVERGRDKLNSPRISLFQKPSTAQLVKYVTRSFNKSKPRHSSTVADASDLEPELRDVVSCNSRLQEEPPELESRSSETASHRVPKIDRGFGRAKAFKYCSRYAILLLTIHP